MYNNDQENYCSLYRSFPTSKASYTKKTNKKRKNFERNKYI